MQYFRVYGITSNVIVDSNLLCIEDFLYSERIGGNSAAIKVIILNF